MSIQKPNRAWLSILGLSAGCLTWLMPAGLLLAGLAWQEKSAAQPQAAYEQSATIPNLLSQKDAGLYATIFSAQQKAHLTIANSAATKLTNKILMGHVLAVRYLDSQYTPKPGELAAWLDRYSDHPQAADIYALALKASPELKDKLPALRKQRLLGGYGDSNGLSRGEDTPATRTWNAGLEAWRNGDKQLAAGLFSSLTSYQGISPWTVSAAAYWSYRAYDALGNSAQADRYLRMAASKPRSFYGILARRQLKQPLNLDAEPETLTDTDILEMIGDAPIRRTIALAQAGQVELAEKELRALFPLADETEKLKLLSLANGLNLASVQVSMANQLGRDGRGFDYARYPIPDWQPEEGFTIDPSLIFAVMRQESGFQPSAVSSGGALGLMQLMPKTAQLMQKNTNRNSGSLTDPSFNMTLGQNYVRHLLDNNLVEGNLLYLLAAYNAGPGRLQEWKKNISNQGDPLLFIERIPYAQTRHYVMQVMTNYWIYCELAGKPSYSVSTILHGHWPSYDNSMPIAVASASGPAG